MGLVRSDRLRKQLKLFDVYVIATGAMFSSGFFLLPGLAVAESGSAVILAYALSGLLIIPAMVSKAELATAMPRAGGAYFFLDRTLGPMMGTLGGVGTWLALMLKSAFALIGMGAYLAIFMDVPLKPTAIALTLVFAALNVIGAKEASALIRYLVVTVLFLLVVFILLGLSEVWVRKDVMTLHRDRFQDFWNTGIDGLLGTVGLVFVSYVGLTKVASLAEEVTNPDRNIPLGMGLSLLTVIGIYTVGVYVMLMVLGVERLTGSLTPVADAAAFMGTWLPDSLLVILIVVAAIAAFASMSNAGILAASRYPLAMARDRLVPEHFSRLSRFRTPVFSVMLTCSAIVVFLLVLDVAEVAKLASALQMVVFALINVAVIVMRESRIESYDPGYHSPLYPWMQLAGILVPVIVIAEMGWLPVLFTLGVGILSFAWYKYYARERIARDGAIYHVFERLGRRRFMGLDRELRDIMKERGGARAEDPFDEVIARAFVIDLAESAVKLSSLVEKASQSLAVRMRLDSADLIQRFEEGLLHGGTPVAHGAALVHARVPGVTASEIVLVRCTCGVEVDTGDAEMKQRATTSPVKALFFLVSGEDDPGQHLRILAHLAGRIEDEDFIEEWLGDETDQELKETLLRDDRFLSLEIKTGLKSERLIGAKLKELKLPEGILIALVRRYGTSFVPRGRTVLREGDRLTIIGAQIALAELAQEWKESE